MHFVFDSSDRFQNICWKPFYIVRPMGFEKASFQLWAWPVANGHVLSTTQPGARNIEHCRRQKCFPCNTGQVGVCRRTGVGYKIICILCEALLSSEYAGESGRNLFNRGEEYIADVHKKAADKPLWKHITEKHRGRMDVELFEHFRMELTGIFSSAQRRKANEGVRIAHLNPDTRMNSKDEFRQGTNITMRPIRGLGV